MFCSINTFILLTKGIAKVYLYWNSKLSHFNKLFYFLFLIVFKEAFAYLYTCRFFFVFLQAIRLVGGSIRLIINFKTS